MKLHEFVMWTLHGGEWSLSGHGRPNSRDTAPGSPPTGEEAMNLRVGQKSVYKNKFYPLHLPGIEPGLFACSPRRLVTN